MVCCSEEHRTGHHIDPCWTGTGPYGITNMNTSHTQITSKRWGPVVSVCVCVQALRRLKAVCLRVAVGPCTVEACTVAVVSHFLLGLPWVWGFILGWVQSGSCLGLNFTKFCPCVQVCPLCLQLCSVPCVSRCVPCVSSCVALGKSFNLSDPAKWESSYQKDCYED